MWSRVKKPSSCHEHDINDFLELVLEGGEVVSAGLRNRVIAADTLVFIGNTGVEGIAALKKPNLAYKKKVFSNASYANDSERYDLELGWLYVSQSLRGQGLSHKLMMCIMKALQGRCCYATTRTDNFQMQKLLPQYGFRKVGKSYKGNGEYFLDLFVST